MASAIKKTHRLTATGDSMAKIGFDSRIVFHEQRSGLGNYAFHLLAAMVDSSSGHQFRLYHDAKACVAGSIGNAEVSFRELPSFPSRFHGGDQFWLPLQAGRDQVSLLHCPANYVPLIQPCPTVVTVHDMVLSLHDEGETRNQLFYWRQLMPMALRKAARIITVSHHSKRDIVNLLDIPEDRVRVIHSGVDSFFKRLDDETVQKGLAALGLQAGYVFMLGASSPRKNIECAVKAFIQLKKQGFSPKLVLTCGNAVFAEKLRNLLAGAGLLGEVAFLPHVSPEDLRVLYNGALSFLYPSLYEGFGFPILEAMACGTTVVTSDTSSMPEVAGDAALLVEPTDPKAIAEALAKIAQSPALGSDLRLKGQLRARDFRWAKAARETLAVYDSILSER
jgi:glycosyltransferase involved in cell wall biosynthesis